jgi:RNA 2',3'-cyclic 3'-phosphodiesterase
VTLGRYFLALRPDAAAAASLARLPIPDGARPTHPEDLHLTVLFIGALQGQGEDDVLAAVRRAHGEVAAQPVVVLDCVEHWPGPRVLCAGGPTDPALADLQAALRGQLAALGLAPDARPLRSHVTLARKVTGRAAPTVPLDHGRQPQEGARRRPRPDREAVRQGFRHAPRRFASRRYDVEVISTGSLGLDIALGIGGLPRAASSRSTGRSPRARPR